MIKLTTRIITIIQLTYIINMKMVSGRLILCILDLDFIKILF